MGPAHLHAFGGYTPHSFIEIDLCSPHEPNVAGAGHGERYKLKRRANCRPAIVFVNRAHEDAELAFVGNGGPVLTLGFKSAPRRGKVGSFVARSVTTA